MKKFPYSFPELGFIILVMLLPLAVGFIWRSETVWGFVGKIAGGVVVGFLIWLTAGYYKSMPGDAAQPLDRACLQEHSVDWARFDSR